ncbi:excinuclease ABC subunit A [Tropicimonas sp. IMCC34043]|uniref:excinuclease ABC subunit A n=1 Tax=Tropicimonas sp. IMCC34043 TaxID=2248760 RepID=UPI000E264E61|nr:excinuclease ABC subunit A [Tropicimonas sp. IMCC34043]
MKTTAGLAAILLAIGLFPGLSQASPNGCPPGLAKKSPACVPPGQAKAPPQYRQGDRIDHDYILVRDPGRYRLDRNGNYVVVGDYIYRIDPQTNKVMNLMGAIADLLN